jgi:hypothetical protein
MRRKSFDILVSAAGLVVAAVLLVASGLLFWANDFVDDNVRTQLTAQKIFIPPAGSEALADPKIKPYLDKYAGQQLTNGAQAQAYADHFIKVHLDASTGGRTYSELSTASRQDPTNAELQGLVQTSFRGETLRGLLLNAYAFWKMGQVALYAAWIAFGAGALLLLLAALGAVHARRVPSVEEIHLSDRRPERLPAG